MTVLPAGIRAVFFDAVGTVLHPVPGAPVVYAQAAGRYGLDPGGLLDRLRTSYLAEEEIDRVAGWVTSEEREIARWRRIVRDTLPGAPAGCFDELYQHFAQPRAWAVPPDAAPTFAALQERGLVLGLASNYDARLESVLAGRPELDLLKRHVVISSRIGVRKPAAAFFAQIVAAAGCPARAVAYVGDDLGNDFRGAAAAGMHAVLLAPAGRHPDVTGPRATGLGELVG